MVDDILIDLFLCVMLISTGETQVVEGCTNYYSGLIVYQNKPLVITTPGYPSTYTHTGNETLCWQVTSYDGNEPLSVFIKDYDTDGFFYIHDGNFGDNVYLKYMQPGQTKENYQQIETSQSSTIYIELHSGATYARFQLCVVLSGENFDKCGWKTNLDVGAMGGILVGVTFLLSTIIIVTVCLVKRKKSVCKQRSPSHDAPQTVTGQEEETRETEFVVVQTSDIVPSSPSNSPWVAWLMHRATQQEEAEAAAREQYPPAYDSIEHPPRSTPDISPPSYRHVRDILPDVIHMAEFPSTECNSQNVMNCDTNLCNENQGSLPSETVFLPISGDTNTEDQPPDVSPPAYDITEVTGNSQGIPPLYDDVIQIHSISWTLDNDGTVKDLNTRSRHSNSQQPT